MTIDDEDPTINNIDEDGDGLGLCSGDCDDTDPDTKRLNRYLDSDGDGYGDASLGVFHLCEGTDGYVVNKKDCDDRYETVYPQTQEIPCDGVDQDCDGEDGM